MGTSRKAERRARLKMTHEEVMKQLHNFTSEELVEELQNAGIELEEIQKGGS